MANRQLSQPGPMNAGPSGAIVQHETHRLAEAFGLTGWKPPETSAT
jgi:hypothetical protein